MAEENAVNRDEFEDEISLGSDEQRKIGINWAQLEQKFVEIITQLNSPPQTKGTLTTAEQKSDFVKQLQLGIEAIIEVTLSESSMFMNEQNYEKAFEGGLKALTFIQRAYGKDSIHQVEAYFLLSKACQLMKKFKQAEEYLSIANWTVVKNRETCPLGLRAELHQHFGLLYVQQKKTKEAMENMAASVYYLALQNGTRDLITSFAYYNLGNAFVTLQNKIEKGIAFMKKVIDIWHDHLLAHLKSEELDKEEYKYSNNLKDLEEDKILDAKRMLSHILKIQTKELGDNHIETGKTYATNGLFEIWIGKEEGKELLRKAKEIFSYVLGDQHIQTTELKQLLEEKD